MPESTYVLRSALLQDRNLRAIRCIRVDLENHRRLLVTIEETMTSIEDLSRWWPSEIQHKPNLK